MLEHRDSPFEISKTCSSVAWSRGLKYFAVRNGSECLGNRNLSSMLSQLDTAKGCLGGRGGQNMSDVYRLTSKKAFRLSNVGLNVGSFAFLSNSYPLLFLVTQ